MTGTLLIVEDEPQLAGLLRDVLTEGGFETILSTGTAAPAAAAKVDPDVIILDYVMPGITGADVVDQMRRQLSRALPPLVLVTGRDDASNIAERLGAAAYLRKPFDVDELLALVTRLSQTE